MFLNSTPSRGAGSLLKILAVAVLTTVGANAAVLTEWNFTLNTTAQSEADTLPATGGDTAHFDVTSSLVSRGPSTDPGPHAGAFWAPAWGGFDTGAYFQFEINPLSGVTYGISDVKIDPAFIQDGPSKYELYSDVGGFPTTIDHSAKLDPSAINYSGLTGPTTFRLYLFGDEGGGGGVSYFGVNGSVGANVPEAFPTAALGVVFAGLAGLKRRLSRSR
jgi:hypothetical protein